MTRSNLKKVILNVAGISSVFYQGKQYVNKSETLYLFKKTVHESTYLLQNKRIRNSKNFAFEPCLKIVCS